MKIIIGKITENSRETENYIKQQIDIESRENIMKRDENRKRFQKKAFDFSFLEHEPRHKSKEESLPASVHPYHKKNCGTHNSGGDQQMLNYDGNLLQSNFI